jgi:rhodanese-related sulfurtransferase
MQTITVTDLARKHPGGEVELIDVRTPVEFRELHAEGAKNVPLDSLDVQKIAESRNGRSGEPMYVICRSGARGAKAVQKLIDAGITEAVNVEGGTLAWEQAGLPVRRGKKMMSLERQVRIAAGFLTLVGALLGFFVHPYFIALSAFIGAGLMFAGITDTCGMGMILAKMPWNRCGDDSGTCAV